jgi:hypothetical protein
MIVKKNLEDKIEKRKEKKKKESHSMFFCACTQLFLYQGGIPSTQLLLFCEPKVSPRNDGN